MARTDWLSKFGLVLGLLLAALVIVVFIGWWLYSPRGGTTGQPVAPHASARGWEIRYNATLALARRGSQKIKQRLGVLAEMLDEGQQLRNFRATLKDGRDVPDETSARGTILSTLKAVDELHSKRADVDLSQLQPALEKLSQSPSVALRTEAEKTRISLTRK